MNKTSKIYKELSNEEIHKIIKNYLQEDVEFEAKLISGGLFNTTYYVEVEKINKKFILRVGPVNKHLLLPFENNLMKSEEYVYRLCKKYGIPYSNILSCNLDGTIINRDYMIVEYLQSSIISNIEVSKEIEDNLYRELGGYVSKLHEIRSNKFGRVYDVYNNEGFDSWSEYILDELLKHECKFREHGIFNDEELSLFKNIILMYKDILDEIKAPCLVHADLWTGNVLVKYDENKYSIGAIIDGDRAIFGDTDFEFANNWLTNEHLFEGYGKRLDTDKKSETRRKIYKLLQILIDTHVYFVEFDKYEWGLDSRANALNLANELINDNKTYTLV